jgi:protein-S-isoprenylcysteine O-methyltransferase Ste14
MDKNYFLALVVLCTIAHIVRLVYEILKHKNKLTANKTTFVIVFANMMILWVSWFALCSLDSFKIEPNIIVKLLGALLSISGLIAFLSGLFTIKTLESYDGDLITKGIYSKIRHPMYFGFILWLVGFPIFFGAIFSFILALPFIANVLFWRHLEEIELSKRFTSYNDYIKTTIF